MNNIKKLASESAIDLIKDNCNVGIGSGSTIVFAVEQLAKKVKRSQIEIKCVPTSFQSRHLIIEHGLPLSSLEEIPQLDIAFDGADEFDHNLTLIKGGGGCLTQEKIIASCSSKFVVICDYSKKSNNLGENWKKGIPIEVIPSAYKPISQKIINKLCGTVNLRMAISKMGPVVTDNGNFLLDWIFPSKEYDWSEINIFLKMIPGVVETGLFVDIAHTIYVGEKNGNVSVLNRNHKSSKYLG